MILWESLSRNQDSSDLRVQNTPDHPGDVVEVGDHLDVAEAHSAHDAQHVVGLVLSAWFFMSPVMYNMDFAARLAAQWPWAANLLYANPLTVIINGYRAALLPGAHVGFPPAAWVGLLLAPAMLIVGAAIYRRFQNSFADML